MGENSMNSTPNTVTAPCQLFAVKPEYIYT